MFWSCELPKLGVCSSLDITEDASLTVLGSDYGLYLLKGREYKGTITPLPEIKVAEVTIVNEPPLLWVLHCNDSLRRVQLFKDGSLLAVTEGWIHYVTSNGVIAWSKPVGPPLKALATENHVIAASLRKIILLTRNGEELWLRTVEGNVEALAFLNNEVVAATWGSIYLISLEGVIKASVEIPVPEEPGFHVGSPWIVAKADPSGSIVAVAYSYISSVLVLVDSEGKIVWSMNLNTPIMTLSLTRTKLILGLGNGTILTADLGERKILWRKMLALNRKAPIINVVATENGEYVVANSKDGIIYLLSGNGEILWNYPRKQGEECYFYSALSEDSMHIAASGSHVVILNRDGKIIWKKELPKENTIEKRFSITPDLKYLAVVASRNTVQYFEVGKLLQQTTSYEPKEHGLASYIVLIVIALITLFVIMLKRK